MMGWYICESSCIYPSIPENNRWLFHQVRKDDALFIKWLLSLEYVEYHDGDAIIQEGTEAEYVYVVQEGSAQVIKEGTDLSLQYTKGQML